MNEEIFKFIKENNIGVLSVLRPGGSIHAASLHYSGGESADLEFYFATSKKSRKAEGLLGGGNIKASMVIGFREEEMVTVQMDGEVHAATTDEEKNKVIDVHYAKHPNARIYKDDEDTLFIIFKPTWWRYSAFKAKPPVFLSSENN